MTKTVAEFEASALRIGMAGNLVMGGAGVLASMLSNSEALLVDGLFSLVGFFAAIIAIRVGRQSSARPDEDHPLGYAADESAFTTFRALSLLGLVVFAFSGAVTKIVSYIGGTTPPAVKFEVIGVYTVAICVICAGLWANHYFTWRKSGKTSDILKLEARAAAFDGVITATAGIGFGLVFLLQDGPLAVIAPIGDSIIVIGLCLIAAGTYWADFTSSLGELVGVSAAKETVEKVRARANDLLVTEDLELVDVIVFKTGRAHSAVVFIKPAKAMTAHEVDTVSQTLNNDLSQRFSRVDVLVVLSEIGRQVFMSDGFGKETDPARPEGSAPT